MSKLLLQIAWSITLARWKQAAVAAGGVTFGIAAFVSLLTFMTGLNELLDKMILDRTPHIRLFHDFRSRETQPVDVSRRFQNSYNFITQNIKSNNRLDIHNAVDIGRALTKDKRILGIAPRVSTQVFFNDGSNDAAAVINGINVNAETILFHFDEYVVTGKVGDIERVPNTIILGAGLAEDLAVRINDRVYITTSRGDRFALKVAGTFRSGLQEYDKVQCFASVATVQKIMNRSSGYVTDIQIKVRNIDDSPSLAREFAERFHTDSEDIKTTNAEFETGSGIRSTISYSVGVTLLIVAGFGIFNILQMMIIEKMDSIAILKATGFTGRDVNTIFIVISMGIGLLGGVMGTIIGFVASYSIDHIPFETKALPTVTTYPVSYDPSLYLIGLTFSLITTYVAGLSPAIKASRVDPVVIIRGK